MSEVRVTYCANVHPTPDLESWLASLERDVAAVAAGRPRPFGTGAWWSADTAARLAADPRARARAAAALERAGLSIWSLNVFPYGVFHGEAVKDRVYRPDWSDPARVRYTLDAATALAELSPPGARISMSTLPLGFGRGNLGAMAANLVDVARHLEELAERKGVDLVLALEPEPFCLLETVEGAIGFLEEWVWRARGAVEELLRRRLGVCVDLCHLAVMGEDPLRALERLRAAGVACGKVQVSCALEVRGPGGLERLLAFDEPTYLHQTVATGDLRALDLGDVAERREEFARAGRARTHFHVPVFWDEPGDFGSTRAEVLRFLGGSRRPLPLLEVETYTWGVLPPRARVRRQLTEGILEELRFVDRALGSGA